MAQGAIPSGNPLEDVHTRTTTTGPQSMACCVGIDAGDTVINTGSAQGVRVDRAGSGTLTGSHVLTTSASPPLPVQINTSTPVPCKSVILTSRPTSAARLVVGGSNVTADPNTLNGIPLDPGQSVVLDIDDVNKLYFNTTPSVTVALTWQVIR